MSSKKSKISPINNRIYFFVAILLLCLFFYEPILSSSSALGIQDWDQNFAWNEFVRLSILKYHQFPFWDPFRCGGAAHFADPQMAVVSIQTLLVLIFGTVMGIKISIFAHGLIGFIGFYLLSKQYGLSKKASVISSIVFSFNGALPSALSTGMVPFIGIAYSPLIIYFYNKGKDNIRWLFVSAGLLSASYYFGYHASLIIVIFLLIYSLTTSILEKNLKPVFRLLFFVGCFVIFSAPKLILSLQLLSVYPKEMVDFSGYNLYSLFYYLFSNKQSLLIDINLKSTMYGITIYGIDENSLYVGLLPAFLFAIFFFKNKKGIKKFLPLLISLIFIIILMFGSNSWISIYDAIKQLPILSSFRVAQRFRFDFIILFSLVAGLGFDRLINIKKISKYKMLLFISIAMIIYIDLTILSKNSFLSHTLIIKNDFKQDIKNDFSQNDFSQLARYNEERQFSFYPYAIPIYFEKPHKFSPWSYEYIAIKNNKGTVYCYDSMNINAKTKTTHVNSPEYKGEWYTKHNSQTISQIKWSPNAISFLNNGKSSIDNEDYLIVNQNYYPGWYVEIDGNLQAAESYSGLLSTRINGENHNITFKFLPYKSILKQIKSINLKTL